MPYVTIEEDVWVDLDDFDTEDLVEELRRRKGISPELATGPSGKDLIEEIYMAKHVRRQSYEHLVDQLISVATGRIV